jgi:hypothetical protein
MSLTSHSFFLDSSFTGASVRELPPPPWQPSIPYDLRFVYDVLTHALPLVKAEHLHFFFTKEAYFLPEYGKHVVPVLLLEERCKVPVYSRHVLATIRNMQSRPYLGFRPRWPMGKLEAVLSFEYARDCYTHSMSRWALNRAHNTWPAEVRQEPATIHIPLGYHSQVQVPIVPMTERRTDLFFAGDIKHPVPRTSYKHWVSTSKFVAREQLWDTLITLKAKGAWNIDVGPNETQSYSERMMSTRICVSPRGTMPETYRSFEGLRAGCLVVGNPVSRESLLYNAPILIVDRWSELESVLMKYARSINLLEEAQTESLAFWNQFLTPQTIAKFVAERLNVAVDTLR